MADDMSEGEQVALFFKQAGIEIVTDAKQSFEHLTEAMKDTAKATDQVEEATKSVDTTTRQVIEVLKSDSTVVEDLKQKIAELTAQQNTLRDSFVAGLIPSASQFKEDFDRLGDSIADKQGILEAATGTGAGEGGKGGFAGLAANVMKAEKVMSGLAGGTGFGRMGGMLESITGALGLAGGTGMAAGGLIFAFEALLPKIEKFMEKMDGAAEATKRAAEALKIYHAEVKKEEDTPTDDEEAAAKIVKNIIKGKGAQELRQGIEQSLVQAGIGLTAEQKAGQYTDENGIVRKFAPEEMEQFGQRSREAAQARAGQLMLELRKGAPGAIAAVRGMSHVPESFQTRLGQTTPEALEAAKRQSQQAEADSEWADTTYAKREAARLDSAAIDKQFDKALKDKKKYDVKAQATGFKDQLGDLKTQLSDLGMDLREKTISPEEYKAKADVLVDAIAASVQGLAKLPGENVKAAHRDVETAQRIVRTTFDHGVQAVKHATDKALHDAKTAIDKWNREHTPEHLTQQQAKAEAAAVMGAEQEQNEYRANMGAMPFDAHELEQIKHKAMQAMPYYKWRGVSLGQLVADMMAMQANEIEQGMSEGLDRHGRSGQLINPKGGH